MKEDIKILRREELEHGEFCPMKENISFNCRCHYEDCLDYTGYKFFRECVCNKLTARELYSKELVRRHNLPFFKKIITYLRKPKIWIFEFDPEYYSFN